MCEFAYTSNIDVKMWNIIFYIFSATLLTSRFLKLFKIKNAGHYLKINYITISFILVQSLSTKILFDVWISWEYQEIEPLPIFANVQ